MRTALIVWVALLAFVVNGRCANAEIIFHQGNIPTDENLQFNDGFPGGPAVKIQGLTNAGTLVDVSRIDLDPILLRAPSSGAARIAATDPLHPARFSGALFETPGFSFQAFEFNVQVGSSGLLTILARDLDGVVHSSALQLGFNGAVSGNNNRFGVTAANGMAMTAVTVQLNGKIVNDIRQVRLGCVAELPPPIVPTDVVNAVPEPAAIVLSTISLVAFGIFGACRIRRRPS